MPSSNKSANKKLNIIGIRPALEGVYVFLECWKCARSFERFLATVAGLAFGRVRCPKCHSIQEIFPDDFLAALECFLPFKSLDKMVELNQDANRIATSWYRIDRLAQLLLYQGVNLGEPTERALFSCISLGLYLDDSRKHKNQK